MPAADTTPFRVATDGADLAGEEVGDGPAVLLLHGLTATRRYVVHGASTIPRAGYRVISYDARGHGESSGAAEYSYAALEADALAVLDARGAERAAVVGQSMGGATAAGLAIRHPERVAALGLITPAHRGGARTRPIAYWDGLADGLQTGGVDGFLAALEPLSMPEKWRDPVRTVIRQRMERHRDRDAVADALRGTQRTSAFELDDLARIAAPTLVVGSRDEIDADHPLAVAEDYARRIPGAELAVEDEGESPLAWRGGALSSALLGLFDRAGWTPAT